MARSRSRVGLVLAGVAIAAVAAPGAAYACNEPRLSVDGTRDAGPSGEPGVAAGDRAPFAISDIQQGARYRLTIDGREVAAGTDDDGRQGFRGSFEVPDLGASNRTVYVRAVVSHDEGEWPSEPRLYYRVATPTAPSPQTPQAEAPPTAAPAPGDSSRPPARARDDGSQSHDPAEPSAGGGHVRGNVSADAVGTALATQEASATATAVSDEAAVASALPQASRTGAPDRATSPDGTHVAQHQFRQLPVPRATGIPDASVTIGFGLFWLAALLAAGAWRFRGRGTGIAVPAPDPDQDRGAPAVADREAAIEAELQEMIAEAAASSAVDGEPDRELLPR